MTPLSIMQVIPTSTKPGQFFRSFGHFLSTLVLKLR